MQLSSNHEVDWAEHCDYQDAKLFSMSHIPCFPSCGHLSSIRLLECTIDCFYESEARLWYVPTARCMYQILSANHIASMVNYWMASWPAHQMVSRLQGKALLKMESFRAGISRGVFLRLYIPFVESLLHEKIIDSWCLCKVLLRVIAGGRPLKA